MTLGELRLLAAETSMRERLVVLGIIVAGVGLYVFAYDALFSWPAKVLLLMMGVIAFAAIRVRYLRYARRQARSGSK